LPRQINRPGDGQKDTKRNCRNGSGRAGQDNAKAVDNIREAMHAFEVGTEAEELLAEDGDPGVAKRTECPAKRAEVSGGGTGGGGRGR